MAASPLVAQEFPDRPVTYVVVFGPGGTVDTGARTLAPFLEACLGQSIVVVNRPGAGGEVGFVDIATSENTGYTIGALNTPNLIISNITKESPNYSMDDFTYLGQIYGSRVTINARKGGEFATFDDIAAIAGERKVNVGITMFGSDDHLVLSRIVKSLGIEANFIPLSDGASVRNALLGGHIDLSGSSVTEVGAFQDELQTLALAAEERTVVLPDVPTLRELGHDVVGGSDAIIGGPANLPAEVVAKFDSCFQSIAEDPEFIRLSTTRNLMLSPMDAAQTTQWVQNEVEILREMYESDPWTN
jgi:tripartite-type tricarboxylate transporter receptor subunit TctC